MTDIDAVREKLKIYKSKEIAKLAGISRATLWRFMHGSDIRASVLNKILAVING